MARIYVCGITPYDVGHLGHAFTYVFFDTVRRYLEFQGLAVQHIQNITDVDDDMVRVSRERGMSIADLTDENHAIYLREMDSLNVLRPNAYPRASDSMPQIIEMIETLVAGGHAYTVDGHVMFDSTTRADFGALAGKTPQELRDGPRTDTMPDEPDHLKRNSLDFLLWQPSDAPGAAYDSPWSTGRPGWHIECSAMATANLGPASTSTAVAATSSTRTTSRRSCSRRPRRAPRRSCATGCTSARSPSTARRCRSRSATS